jgi:hypothetical protein
MKCLLSCFPLVCKSIETLRLKLPLIVSVVALRLIGAPYLVGIVLGHASMRYQLCDDVLHVLTDIHKFPR